MVCLAACVVCLFIVGTGYGDYSPQSGWGRAIACIYMLVSTVIMAMFFDKLSSYVLFSYACVCLHSVRACGVVWHEEISLADLMMTTMLCVAC